ncbi:MAG TPA: class I SAM-dependent rRNA methyltransferase [Chlamydiales bacterium]|nr:class I SAM-dependent rRNA methyltransferase [Chlamydiales bacterium]
MQALSCLKLKKGKEKPILQYHHWIYSGAVASLPSGTIAEVESFENQKLGIALLNPGHSIAAHMIAFGDETLEEALQERIQTAAGLRKIWFNPKMTNAVRLINAEGDRLPGLIVDQYDDVLVLQISHPALESLKEKIICLLAEEFRPFAIYEKSTSFLRKKSGMQEARSLLFGKEKSEVEVLENGLKFSVDLQTGQKTGFFLDQREMRSCVREYANQRRVLNGFAYTGGFSVAALAGGATHVDSVEISARCKERFEKNLALNGLQSAHWIEADFFDFLKTDPLDYDLIILDPPAFVKKRSDIANGFRAYKELNRLVLAKMRSGSLLLSCCCSYHVDETLFQNILFRAAIEAHRSLQILGRHRLALDHPISIFHPESAYLKSFLLYVR